MEYFNEQNTEGYTSEQLNKMNQEIEAIIKENGFDPDFHQQEIKTAQERILAEMDRKIEEEQTDAEKLADMMNNNQDIPDSAIDEFEKNPKGTLKKYTRIDNTHYYKDVSISEEKHTKIVEFMEDNPYDFFQAIINEFAVEYDSNVMTEEIILKLEECKKLAEKLVNQQ